MPDAPACPACNSALIERVGVKIGKVWHYCWLCEDCGYQWDRINEAEDKRKESDGAANKKRS